MAQGAIQGGRHAADQILRRLRGEESGQPFVYHDKGSMATISRFRAVMKRGNLELTGYPAWAAWLAVHLFYIIGFKSQLTTLMHWAVSFLGRGRAERARTARSAPSPSSRCSPAWRWSTSARTSRTAAGPDPTGGHPHPEASTSLTIGRWGMPSSR